MQHVWQRQQISSENLINIFIQLQNISEANANVNFQAV
jgi:hypothetical protein